MTVEPKDSKPVDDNQQMMPSCRADVQQWCCPNCGQHIFVMIDAEPPDMCQYCNDMTTWQTTVP